MGQPQAAVTPAAFTALIRHPMCVTTHTEQLGLHTITVTCHVNGHTGHGRCAITKSGAWFAGVSDAVAQRVAADMVERATEVLQGRMYVNGY
jgi:hypothetical protein